jgi:hypothetical protein
MRMVRALIIVAIFACGVLLALPWVDCAAWRNLPFIAWVVVVVCVIFGWRTRVSTLPDGETPTVPALQGALAFRYWIIIACVLAAIVGLRLLNDWISTTIGTMFTVPHTRMDTYVCL